MAVSRGGNPVAASSPVADGDFKTRKIFVGGLHYNLTPG